MEYIKLNLGNLVDKLDCLTRYILKCITLCSKLVFTEYYIYMYMYIKRQAMVYISGKCVC